MDTSEWEKKITKIYTYYKYYCNIMSYQYSKEQKYNNKDYLTSALDKLSSRKR